MTGRRHGNRKAAIVRDPVRTAVLANRLDGIVREMSNTLLRAARSHVIAVAHDFSCSIVTSDNQLLSAAEGLPVHTFGMHLQAQSMCELHADLAEGDAFLHNDVYNGNTHAADHTLLAPVFVGGQHLFTVCAKAHQADIGNALPTTYAANAKDVYEEGALVFPCVRVERNYRPIADVIRMCQARIRVPDQWYGDFLAAIGAVRIGERRLKEFCDQYGLKTVKAFVRDWLDYSEARMVQAIRRLPRATISNEGMHDPVEPMLPDGIPVKMKLTVDPVAAMIEVDLRDNIDCIPCGLNLSEACSLNGAILGVFNCLEPDIPHNAGSFRRVRVRLRDGSVVGRPSFPHSCSVSTTAVIERVINMVQGAFARLGDGHGLSEGCVTMGAAMAVVSGRDFRRNGQPYVNQMFLNFGGGPASPKADGWVNFCLPTAAGMVFRDSVELCEAKYPLHIRSMRLLSGTAGPGRMRGGPGNEVIYGPRRDAMTAIIPSDGHRYPPRGVLRGGDGTCGETYKIARDGSETKLGGFVQVEVEPGEWLRGIECSGGGYGDPLERDPYRVLRDVAEGWEPIERAQDTYGVILVREPSSRKLRIDLDATLRQRAKLAALRKNERS